MTISKQKNILHSRSQLKCDRHGEGTRYGNLGTGFISIGDYVKANEYLGIALAIAIEIGRRQKGEQKCYENLGTVFISRGDFVKAKEYLEKAIAIAVAIGETDGEGTCYGSLATVLIFLGDYVKAKKNILRKH